MNFSKFIQKAAAFAVAGSTVLGAASPALAAVNTSVIEEVPSNGMRFNLVDTGSDLEDVYVDWYVRDGHTAYDLGTLYIYGDDEDDTSFTNAYEQLVLEVGSSLDGDYEEFGFVRYNATNDEYTTYLYEVNGANLDLYLGSTTEDEDDVDPENFESGVDNLFDDARAGGVDTANADTTANVTASGLVNGSLLTTDVTSGGVHMGETEQITSYLDEVYMYFKDSDDQYYARVNLEYGGDLMEADTDEVQNLRVVARGTRGRVEFNGPENMDGVVAYRVDLDNGTTADTTHHSVLFFATDTDTEYDVEVSTVNQAGDESSGITGSADSDVGTAADNLTDIDGDTFEMWISYLYLLSVVDGFSDNTFRPGDDVTRGQFAKFAFNAFQVPFNAMGDEFSDVGADNVFFPYIMSLKNAGISVGFSDMTYRPDDNITRAEAMTIVHRAATYFDEDVVDGAGTACFPDISGSVHAGAICALAQHGDGDFAPIVGGYSDGEFKPDEDLSRGAMSKITLNAAASIEKEDLTTGDDASFVGIRADEGLNEAGVNNDAGFHVAWGDHDDDGDVDAADTATDLPFNFVRPFMAPKAVEGFTSDDESTVGVELEWDSLLVDDSSVDGYVIQRRVVDDSEEEVMESDWSTPDGASEGVMSLIATQATTTVTVTTGASSDSDDIKLTLAGNEYEFDVNNGDDVTTVASAIVSELNGADGFSVSNVAGAITITSDVPGVSFSYSFSSGGGIAYDTASATVAPGTAGVGVVEGVVPVYAANTSDLVNYVDTDVDEGTQYEYRIAAFKFVPYGFATGDTYDDMAEVVEDGELELDTLMLNAVFGTWEYTTVSVPTEDQV
ncbi:S-layer homology domain-containing protein [Candidatus Dojkabacteria bacterium]|uniref:S-layer homology domain-containing protein n=1 Tax=Candidatus Dojkabacteria bacterium TaxID=2099670 RepID=A0A955L7B2_9BACT|nr:S-layer homology domain-containing protein [Candidatus Dojkabacteria bacterium]